MKIGSVTTEILLTLSVWWMGDCKVAPTVRLRLGWGFENYKRYYRSARVQVLTSLNNFVLLSNSSPKSNVQTSVLGLGVDFVFPLVQEEQEQQEEPSPKSTRWK